MIVPDSCLPLLYEQRTHLTALRHYGEELRETYHSFADALPIPVGRPARILDIGCGMAGIDVFLYQHYRYYKHRPEIVLADKQGVANVIVCGFQPSKDHFSHYHDFSLARQLLAVNGVPESQLTTWDLHDQGLPDTPSDVVISLLSWGFHYPIADYQPVVAPGGVIIAECRIGTDGEAQLAQYGACTVVHVADKYRRIVCQVPR